MKKILSFIVCIFTAFIFASCGGTTVKVKQSSDGVNATISVETNNPTSVDVTPSVSVKLDDIAPILDSVQDTLSFDENGELSIDSNTLRRILKSYY